MKRFSKHIKNYCLYFSILFLLMVLLFHQTVIAETEPKSEPLPAESETKIETEAEELETPQEVTRQKIVVIGDSYGVGYTPDDSVDTEKGSWPKLVISQNGTDDSIAVSKNGAGFVKSNEGENFTSLLEKAWEQSDDPESVEAIIVCGGYNDMYYSDSSINYAVQFFALTAKKLFPNAIIYIGMISWDEENPAVQSKILNTILPAYRQSADKNGMQYISGCEYILQNSFGAFTEDHVHPNASGQILLADYINRYLQGDGFFTGLKLEEGQWYWYENGSVKEDFTGLKKNEYGFWYIKDGKVDFSYTGFAKNETGWWYVEQGKVSFEKNDIIYGLANADPEATEEEAWWLVKGSKVTSATTVALNRYGWWYVKDGKVDFSFCGIQKNEYGWWYVKDGKVDFNYYGFSYNEFGWWYIEKGQVLFNKNDIIYGEANVDAALEGISGWWFVVGSRVTQAETVAMNAYGWWYVNNGQVDFTYTGVKQNEYGWWYIHDGKADFTYTGFGANEYGWWYVVNGKVDFSRNDILYGMAAADPDAECENAWWLVRGGKVTGETTVAKNVNGQWYVRDGKVDFSHTGFVFVDNGIWFIKQGKATLITRY